MRILIVTDAWEPQVNGVVRTLEHRARAERIGHTTSTCHARGLPHLAVPDLSRDPARAAARARRWRGRIDDFEPDAIHIATEGRSGLAARRHCLRIGAPSPPRTTPGSPNTCTPAAACRSAWTYRLAAAGSTGRPQALMVATPSIARELAAHGFDNLAHWSRGVDTELFRPRDQRRATCGPAADLPVRRTRRGREEHRGLPRPRPARDQVASSATARRATGSSGAIPTRDFAGVKHGGELAPVLPARRMSSSSPAAPTPSACDARGHGLRPAGRRLPGAGADRCDRQLRGRRARKDLAEAALKALELDRNAVRRYALRYSCRSRRSSSCPISNPGPRRPCDDSDGRGGMTSLVGTFSVQRRRRAGASYEVRPDHRTQHHGRRARPVAVGQPPDSPLFHRPRGLFAESRNAAAPPSVG